MEKAILLHRIRESKPVAENNGPLDQLKPPFHCVGRLFFIFTLMKSPEILYEDNHIIAVNKPAGMLIQGDKTGDTTLPDIVKEYLRVKYNKPGNIFLGVVHRLDRPVSGVVLFARTSKATSRLNEAFRSQKVNKTYLAIVQKEPPFHEDLISGYLSKDQTKNKSYLSQNKQKGKYSELSYKWLGSYEKHSLLEVSPFTGRHHQIRVMLNSIGCTIKGDLKYGAAKPNSDGNICLHASAVKFIHPVKKEPYVIEAPLPKTSEWNEFKGLLT